jgi:predicted O-methyltransferase YrrM
VPAEVSVPSCAQFDDLEAELTYLLLRDTRPGVVVEISPCGGWSTAWILNALRDNGHGVLHSFDTRDDSLAKVPADLADQIRQFHVGDVIHSPHIPAEIDYLFMDSDHTAPFAQWFTAQVFPRVRSGGTVSVHDIFHPGGPAMSGGEGPVVLEWLRSRGIDWITASPTQDPATFQALTARRDRNGAVRPVHSSSANPAILFVMP